MIEAIANTQHRTCGYTIGDDDNKACIVWYQNEKTNTIILEFIDKNWQPWYSVSLGDFNIDRPIKDDVAVAQKVYDTLMAFHRAANKRGKS